MNDARACGRGLRVDHREAPAGLPGHIPGKDMFVGNCKPVQHPVVRIGGECSDGFSCFHLSSLSNYQNRRLGARVEPAPQRRK
jgi:hypothetical protein